MLGPGWDYIIVNFPLPWNLPIAVGQHGIGPVPEREPVPARVHGVNASVQTNLRSPRIMADMDKEAVLKHTLRPVRK